MTTDAKPNDGGPAFPCEMDFRAKGMSLRDYFAAHAPPLPQFIAERFLEMKRTNEPEDWGPNAMPWGPSYLKEFAAQEARWRLAFADAMLAKQPRAEPSAPTKAGA